ncbi:hypothetical protein [Candidatus Similichlamydia epinepheli]|uniref:hypothetical protein n=1 Tax=Candidatus Similichlamydia epinepheli TaxID=1903953 RepID=UPI001300AEE7|nr:hypothetical protein [Candidatus Similichlamydia epinepheli]
MSLRDKKGESILSVNEDDPSEDRHCQRRIVFAVFGFFSVFCLTLGIGFLHQSRTSAKTDAHFQARRVVDMWDREVSKRDVVIRKADEIPDWAFSSHLIKGSYLQRKILSDQNASNDFVDLPNLDRLPSLRDFQEVTLLALQKEWKQAFIKGEKFLRMYHVENLLKEGRQDSSGFVEVTLEGILVPIQYLRQIAFAREMNDPVAERQAIEAISSACLCEEVKDFLDIDKPLNGVHSMFSHCFRALSQGSVSFRSYLAERLEEIQAEG